MRFLKTFRINHRHAYVFTIYVCKLFTSTTIVFIHFGYYQKYEPNSIRDSFVSELGKCRKTETHKKTGKNMTYLQTSSRLPWT